MYLGIKSIMNFSLMYLCNFWWNLQAFVVKYKIGEDVDLAEHFDNAEVTLNVSLSDNHEGKSFI